ncbi:hypothetical protein [Acidocella aromatica]|uniref:Uncharacterized protein n=1 Tax=Acidocella aromatica TaxID=1303579 RepID=A0A840VMG4_9PROT|nr:hypothetical protein [Acidocella aromatica]MBB5374315.1 hypothetical protein [Acidocella aromatica]
MSTEAVAVLAVGVGLLALLLIWGSLFRRPGDGQILATGMPGRATVLSVQETKPRGGVGPEALVRLDVAPREGAHFEVLLQIPFTQRHARALKPGQVVPVRFDVLPWNVTVFV